MTETERAYLAGFLDGDGCIHISRTENKKGSATPFHRLVVVLAQANGAFLHKWQEKTGLGRVNLCARAGTDTGRNHTKDFYQWQISSAEAETILRWILPYLDIKKGQAEVALRYRKTKLPQGGCGPRATPQGIIDLREHYRQELVALKKAIGQDGNNDEEIATRISELEALFSSQAELPGFSAS